MCTQLHWRAQWIKGTSVFDNLKRSKVNKEFLQSRKITRLNFNSTQFQLLNFNYDSLLDNENASLTFDLLELTTVIPFFHWALQLKVMVTMITTALDHAVHTTALEWLKNDGHNDHYSIGLCCLDHAVWIMLFQFQTHLRTMAAEQLAGNDNVDFFCSLMPPENLDSVRTAVREFMMHHHGNNRPVVLITLRNLKTMLYAYCFRGRKSLTPTWTPCSTWPVVMLGIWECAAWCHK